MAAVLDKTEWLQARRTGVGGSDAAAVVGLSKWRTPLAVYMDKIGQGVPVPENEAMRWGKILEPVVRQEYANHTGRTILQPEKIIRHPKHEFMIASLDGFTADERVVEIKTSRTGDGWGEAEDDIPTDYLMQVQHYMAVTGYTVTDIAVLIGGAEFRIYEVPADEELQGILIEREAAFWQRVEQEKPPAPIAVSDLLNFFSVKPGNVLATPELSSILTKLKEVKAALKDQEIIKTSLEDEIKMFLGEKDVLLDAAGNTLATWKLSKASEKFDLEKFKENHPKLYAKYTSEGKGSRRFLVK